MTPARAAGETDWLWLGLTLARVRAPGILLGGSSPRISTGLMIAPYTGWCRFETRHQTRFAAVSCDLQNGNRHSTEFTESPEYERSILAGLASKMTLKSTSVMVAERCSLA